MPPTMRTRFSEVVAELVDRDPRVAVVLADIGVAALADSGVTTRHPDRVVNVGIREQAMIGVAAGMALSGLRPFVHTYAPFLVERPFEQIKLDLGHQGTGAVLVSVGASYDASASGRTHHAPGDVALLATLPGWTVEVPGHPDEVETVLRRAATGGDLVYVRLAEDTNASPVLTGNDGMAAVRTGTAGSPTVLAVGPMLDRTLAATTDLDVTVVYVRTVRPLDGVKLRSLVTGGEVILVEPYLAGTSSAAVASSLRDRPMRMLGLGVSNVELRRYGTRTDHDELHGLDVAGIRRDITDFLRPHRCRCASLHVA
jgi:transketolase